MAEAAEKRWSVDEFFAWQERQEDRYELVDGFPLRMMAGASNRHGIIVVNMVAELRDQLRGSGCRPFTADGSVETSPGQIRRPDAGVDSGKAEQDGFKAAAPRMVAEVPSPSTRDFDTIAKLAEYKAVPTLDHILFIEPNWPEAVLWSRGRDRSWIRSFSEGLETAVEMPSLGITLAMVDLYDGVVFPTGPRLIRP